MLYKDSFLQNFASSHLSSRTKGSKDYNIQLAFYYDKAGIQ